MSYIVSFFAALHRPSMDQRVAYSEHPTKAEMQLLYYSPISPRLT
jgi:hypothetical protein